MSTALCAGVGRAPHSASDHTSRCEDENRISKVDVALDTKVNGEYTQTLERRRSPRVFGVPRGSRAISHIEAFPDSQDPGAEELATSTPPRPSALHPDPKRSEYLGVAQRGDRHLGSAGEVTVSPCSGHSRGMRNALFGIHKRDGATRPAGGVAS
jgi:hypothetical protein